MEKAQIVDFNRRLTQCNRSELVVITYDIYFVYASDARSAYEREDYAGFVAAVHKAEAAVRRLLDTLDYKYELSRELGSLYQFCLRELARSVYGNHLEGVSEASKILATLYTGFVEVAKEDASAPLMQNAQQVVVGMTYGRGSLVENYTTNEYNRGFFV